MRLSFSGGYSITRTFGVYDPAYANYPGSCHPGTDWGLPANTQLLAGMSGRVSIIDRDPALHIGRGKEVVITNGNLQRKTCHMNRIDVADGQQVTMGQPIGLSGFTGYVIDAAGGIGTPGGAHLHDELLIGGIYVPLVVHLTNKEEDMIIDEELANLLADTLRYDPGSGADEAFRATFIGMDMKKALEEFQTSPEFGERRALLGGEAPAAIEEIKQVLSKRGLL